MNYKGYTAEVTYEADERVYHGYIPGIQAMITFEAATMTELEREFRFSVDMYLDYCAEEGLTPETPVPERKRAAS
jgi:predicted HicB family RNase H-like nuclease